MATKISNSRERIKQLMEFYNLSQTDLCKRTGLKKSALSNYINGEREPRQNQISIIADPFNVNPAWLMGYDAPMHLNPLEAIAALTNKAAEASSETLKMLNENANLMDEVTDIVNRYRSLPDDKKLDFQRYLKFLQSDV